MGRAGEGTGSGTKAGSAAGGAGWTKKGVGGCAGLAATGGAAGGGGGTGTGEGDAAAAGPAGAGAGAGAGGGTDTDCCTGCSLSGCVPHGRLTLPACTVTGSDEDNPPVLIVTIVVPAL